MSWSRPWIGVLIMVSLLVLVARPPLAFPQATNAVDSSPIQPRFEPARFPRDADLARMQHLVGLAAEYSKGGEWRLTAAVLAEATMLSPDDRIVAANFARARAIHEGEVARVKAVAARLQQVFNRLVQVLTVPIPATTALDFDDGKTPRP